MCLRCQQQFKFMATLLRLCLYCRTLYTSASLSVEKSCVVDTTSVWNLAILATVHLVYCQVTHHVIHVHAHSSVVCQIWHFLFLFTNGHVCMLTALWFCENIGSYSQSLSHPSSPWPDSQGPGPVFYWLFYIFCTEALSKSSSHPYILKLLSLSLLSSLIMYTTCVMRVHYWT